MKMYGIANCDTVKKARVFLSKQKVEFEFIDFKKSPPTSAQVSKWKEAMGEWPVNKKGPTFRKVALEFEAASVSEKMKLILEHPSMIKRPILELHSKSILFAFDEEVYSHLC